MYTCAWRVWAEKVGKCLFFQNLRKRKSHNYKNVTWLVDWRVDTFAVEKLSHSKAIYWFKTWKNLVFAHIFGQFSKIMKDSRWKLFSRKAVKIWFVQRCFLLGMGLLNQDQEPNLLDNFCIFIQGWTVENPARGDFRDKRAGGITG